jgi:hypothetical protein
VSNLEHALVVRSVPKRPRPGNENRAKTEAGALQQSPSGDELARDRRVLAFVVGTMQCALFKN